MIAIQWEEQRKNDQLGDSWILVLALQLLSCTTLTKHFSAEPQCP